MKSLASHRQRVAEINAENRIDGRRFEIAVKHAAWASAAGFTPREVILSVGQALPVNPDWGDVIYALVYAQVGLDRRLRPRRVA